MPLRKASTDSHLYAVRRSIDRERPRIEGIFDFKGTFVAVIQHYILPTCFIVSPNCHAVSGFYLEPAIGFEPMTC